MGKTKKGAKGIGYEYWGKRPVSRNHGAVPGRESKTRTHRLERIEAKEQIQEELKDISDEIKQRIQAYADKHGISFEEAQKRAKLVIDGQAIPVGDTDDRERIGETD